MNFQARTKLYKALLFVVVCVLAIMIAPSARGQATGSFSGNLADKSGGAIPSATVTVTAQETGQVRTTKTDSTGHYLVPLLPVGLFTVKVDAAGFQSTETKDLRLQVDEARELDFTLVPATVVTTVAVAGDAVAVETANPSLGPGDHLAGSGATAAQWPRLRAARHADRRRNGRDESQQLFHLGQRQRSGRARFVFSVGGRLPPQQHRLAAGWRRQ